MGTTKTNRTFKSLNFKKNQVWKSTYKDLRKSHMKGEGEYL